MVSGVFLNLKTSHVICQTEEDVPFHITGQELSVGLPISANLKTSVIFPSQACVFSDIEVEFDLAFATTY